ncbi:sensor domain-containing diguanylate cyclase [Vibrio paucivorans]
MDGKVDSHSPLTSFTSTSEGKVPLAFLEALAQSKSLDQILNCTSLWMCKLFQAHRCSIALAQQDEFLHIYSLKGNDAIPADQPVPIQHTLVGQAFTQHTTLKCDDMSSVDLLDCQWLSSGGLHSCIDAPLVSDGTCYGTVNIAHENKHRYNQSDVQTLTTIAHWIASQIRVQKEVDAMRTLADIDPLTAILNRRAFSEATQQFGQHSRYHDGEHALLMLDLDRFKSINDQYGHLVGDEVLVSIAQIIRAQIRHDDLFARIGGEEFALLLRNTSEEAAVVLAEKLRAAIECTPTHIDNHQVHCTASFGIAIPHPSDVCFRDLMSRADHALYTAKRRGRNRVFLELKA